MTEPKRLTDEELAAIKQRAEKATPGPLKAHHSEILFETGIGLSFLDSEQDQIGTFTSSNRFNDAEFAAHAREDVLRLVEEVRRLRKALHEIANVDEGHSSIDCNIMRDLARNALR